MKIVIPRKKNIRIVLLGVGGTGGYVAPHLFRLAYSLAPRARLESETEDEYATYKKKERYIDIILADGDTVEKKNLLRQNFTERDLDKNKAEVLSQRYSAIYGIETYYIPDYIEEEEHLCEILSTDKYNIFLPILIGCVDNNRTRILMHDVFNKLDEIIYIDSGNSEFHGQIVIGYKYKGTIVLNPAAHFYPDLLEVDNIEDEYKSLQSCGDTIVSSPQNIMANIMAATIITGYINNIVTSSVLETQQTLFSAKTMNCRSEYLKEIK